MEKPILYNRNNTFLIIALVTIIILSSWTPIFAIEQGDSILITERIIYNGEDYYVVERELENGSFYSEGLLAVKSGGKYGYSDKNGRLVIPYKYDEPGIFSEGLAAVKLNDKYGFIDKSGKEITPFKYEEANIFSEGLAAVNLNDKYGFIDNTGKEVIPFIYDSFYLYANNYLFKNGIVAVRLDNKVGYIDKTGKTVIPFEFYDVIDFSEGLAAAKKNTTEYGFINKKGAFVIPPKFSTSGDTFSPYPQFKNGVAIVTDWFQEYLIDEKGNVIKKFDNHVEKGIITDDAKISEGLIGVEKRENWYNSKKGFMNIKGEIVIPFIFDRIRSFKEGMAAVSVGDKWGFINKKGELVIPYKYDRIQDFSEGLAAVQIDKKTGFIDKKGKLVIPAIYDDLRIYDYSSTQFGKDGIEMVAKGRILPSKNTGFLETTNIEITNKYILEIIKKSLAVPTSSRILVDETRVSLDGYMINGNNYFKLRDLATVLKGTEKEFEIVWDNKNKSMNLLTGKSYTPIGGELTKGEGLSINVIESNASIFLNDDCIELSAFNIYGNNYFKLRDIGEALDFDVSWDAVNDSISIYTRSH